jgi:hypothetical protein
MNPEFTIIISKPHKHTDLLDKILFFPMFPIVPMWFEIEEFRKFPCNYGKPKKTSNFTH